MRPTPRWERPRGWGYTHSASAGPLRRGRASRRLRNAATASTSATSSAIAWMRRDRLPPRSWLVAAPGGITDDDIGAARRALECGRGRTSAAAAQTSPTKPGPPGADDNSRPRAGGLGHTYRLAVEADVQSCGSQPRPWRDLVAGCRHGVACDLDHGHRRGRSAGGVANGALRDRQASARVAAPA